MQNVIFLITNNNAQDTNEMADVFVSCKTANEGHTFEGGVPNMCTILTLPTKQLWPAELKHSHGHAESSEPKRLSSKRKVT